MTWHEIISDLSKLYGILSYIGIRALFAFCVVVLPIALLALILGIWYLKWKEKHPNAE